VTRKIWSNSTETISAESAEAAVNCLEQIVGQGYADECGEFVPLDDEAVVKIVYQDDPAEEAPWANTEPLATVERLDDHLWRVTAPAHIWAKFENGLIGSSEW